MAAVSQKAKNKPLKRKIQIRITSPLRITVRLVVAVVFANIGVRKLWNIRANTL
jgi:hypothetical protein